MPAPRRHLPTHAAAWTEFKRLCSLNLHVKAYRLVQGGWADVPLEFDRNIPARADIPIGGGFYLEPSDLADDPALLRFALWFLREGKSQPNHGAFPASWNA
jgi:hypothetical protein